MAFARRIFAFSASCALVFTSRAEEDCTSQSIADSDSGLSLLQTSARQIGKHNVATAASHPDHEETGYILVIRHGERCTSDYPNLAPMGILRAAYIARCMTQDSPTAGLPFGKPQDVVIGSGLYTTTMLALETAGPLARKIGVTPKVDCNQFRVNSMVNTSLIVTPPEWATCLADKAREALTNNGTVVAAWIHTHIPQLMQNLAGNIMAFNKWPSHCKSLFKESRCVENTTISGGPGGAAEPPSSCYDAFYQIKMTRPHSSASWTAQEVKVLQEGFGGTAHSPCRMDLEVHH